jgi:REP element-mobilizing transposase RayT
MPLDHEVSVQSSNARTKQKEHVDVLIDSSSSIDDYAVFEPVSTNPYNISYTCLVIPRFGSHYLAGDLACILPHWMQQICISFGWRLGFLTVDREYLEWGIHVPPTIPPSYFTRIIRQQTSLQIFSDFPRIRRENLSNDFWAMGYLVTIGTLPYPPVVVQQFIRQIREQQGGNYINREKQTAQNKVGEPNSHQFHKNSIK